MCKEKRIDSAILRLPINIINIINNNIIAVVIHRHPARGRA
jgi:hypothetical protein